MTAALGRRRDADFADLIDGLRRVCDDPIPRPARLMTLVRRFLAAVRDLTPIDVLPRKTTR